MAVAMSSKNEIVKNKVIELSQTVDAEEIEGVEDKNDADNDFHIDAENLQRNTDDVRETWSVEIEGLPGLLTKKIIDFEKTPRELDEPIICRIPADIRANHEKEYDPEIVAIGPLHRSTEGHEKEITPRLKLMEDVKLKFLRDLCTSTAKNKGITEEDVLKKIITVVQKHEVQAKKKYSQLLFQNMCSGDFVQMLVLDGCFIVELLQKSKKNELWKALPMTFQDKIIILVRRDLLLYENQIPFFILEEIHGTCFPTTVTDMSNSQSIRSLAIEFFGYEEEFRDQNIHHLLHLCHKNMVGEQNPIADNEEVKDTENCTPIFYNFIKTIFNSLVVFMIFILLSPALLLFGLLLLIWSWWNYCWNTKKYEPSMGANNIPTATQLAKYGFRFQRKQIVGSGSFMDASFKDGIIEIPHVYIDDSTSSKYRNLLALELSCKMVYGDKFTSYVILMDDLIDTADDVALLRKNKILDNYLGSVEEVAKNFNEMCKK